MNGKKIKALAQATKQSWVYVFDRATGEPIWPIEELPVPQGDVPGEWYSPTQPFPTKPAPFDRHGVTIDDLIDFTPELRAEAIRIASEYKLGSIFTPPIVAGSNGLRGMLSLPALTGGSNWPGGAVDPETGIFYVVSSTNPASFSVDPSWLADNLPVGAGPAAAVDWRMRCAVDGSVPRRRRSQLRKPRVVHRLSRRQSLRLAEGLVRYRVLWGSRW